MLRVFVRKPLSRLFVVRVAVIAAIVAIGAPAFAQDAAPSSIGNPFRAAFKAIGLVMDPPPPQDFVVKTRPAQPEEYIGVGRKPEEHAVKVKTPAELKAMEADLDATRERHDAARAAFPPAAKAVADAEREKREKQADKGRAKSDAKNAAPAAQ